ncbi:Uu.00g038950.m01.CDS01 [Anthostomella pinea]|uniref:Uu.00g038950.m01.CDS01 n=1 Tax=Anthostomella pinea TaxID=933095 RepID=A0AAI8VAK0_9PEZI|nr:Uu.00g038950.m01.CDS01 [Anthostomella pinea]
MLRVENHMDEPREGNQHSLAREYEAIVSIGGDYEPPPGLENLISRAADTALDAIGDKTFSYEDGPALFDLAYYHKGWKYLKTSVLPVVESNIISTAFVLNFLKTLHQSMRRRQVPQEEAKSAYKKLAQLAIQNFDSAASAPSAPTTSVSAHSSMLWFISSLFELGLEEQLNLFLDAQWVGHIGGDEFKSLWIPLLQDLFHVIGKHGVLLSEPRWLVFYQSIITAYLFTCVGERPKETYSTKTVECLIRCKDCTALNEFLADPTRQVGCFPLAKARRQHLHSRIEAAGDHCTHETVRSTRPETLVVTKRSSGCEADVKSWEERRVQAEKQLDAFDQQKLRVVLADLYQDIMSMAILESEGIASGQTNSSSTRNPRPPLAPVSGNPA